MRSWGGNIPAGFLHSNLHFFPFFKKFFFLEFCTAHPIYSYFMIWHQFGEVSVPRGESEIISVQKNTWQGAGGFCDVFLLGKMGNKREKKIKIKAQISWNQLNLSGT